MNWVEAGFSNITTLFWLPLGDVIGTGKEGTWVSPKHVHEFGLEDLPVPFCPLSVLLPSWPVLRF